LDDPGGYLISLFPQLHQWLFAGSFHPTLGILSVVILLIVSGLISASEVAFFSLSPKEIDQIEEGTAKKRLTALLGKPKSLLATILLLNNTVNIGVVVVSDDLLKNVSWQNTPEWLAFLVKVVLITFIILLFGEITPKVYATKHNLTLAKFFSGIMFFLVRMFRPFTWILVNMSSFLDNRLKKKGNAFSVDKLTDALELTTGEEISDEEHKMLKGIAEFGSLDVYSIMTPRTDVAMVNVAMKMPEVLHEILKTGYSRMPVFREKEDQIVGILYIKDILPFLNETEDFVWPKLVREPFFVPENKKIDDLLKEFQSKKMHMALVVDEFGGFEGLVTLEDIIEQIIGEINDEHDDDAVDFHKITDSEFIFAGKTSVTDFLRIVEFEKDFFADIESEPETLAGVLLELSGKIPAREQKITFKNITFRVLNADTRRVNRVKVSILPGGDSKEVFGKTRLPLGIVSGIFLLSFFSSCGGDKDPIPRPKGYWEIAFPQKEYQRYDSLCPFTFEYPVYARISPFSRDASKTCWFDIVFPDYRATLHLSYEDVGKDFVRFSEDQHTLAYKHTSKANAIEEIFIEATEDRVWGIIYDIQGDAASNFQFHVTDSQHHFLRGSLYFDFKANQDSTAPVLEFLKQDITRLVETVKWK
jgi:putative hemolysin